jgi:alcohol dehydrogenase class IV
MMVYCGLAGVEAEKEDRMVYEILGPRKIIAGENSIASVPNEMKQLGRRYPLIVTDRGIVKTGLLNRLTFLFDDGKVKYKVFSEVEPDPEIAIMEKGKNVFKEGRHDILIALGGGSSIDTAKVLSFLATNEGTVKDYLGMVSFKNDPIPIIAIPTTAGTGSEVSHAAIVTDQENKAKLFIKGIQLAPKAAVLDPILLKSLPPESITYPGIDAFTHAVESFLSTRSNFITQQLSLVAAKLIYQALIPFKENPGDTELGFKMLYGSCLAGIAMTNGGATVVHALALPIGSHYHLPHGLTCALFLRKALRENSDAVLDKYAIVLEALGFRREGLSTEDCADKLIETVDELMRKLGIPTSLKSLGIKHEVLPEMIEDVLKSPGMMGNPKKFDRNKIEEFLISVR